MKIINLFIIGLIILTSAIALPILPDQIPMHWNIAGEVDNWMPKQQAVWFFPFIITGMWLLFQLLPKFDPKREKYVLFQPEWNIIQTVLIGFFAYIQLITFYAALHPDVKMLPLLFLGLGALFILIGNYLSKIRQNYFIGVRLPWTLASEENWNKTHRYASWCFVITGIVILVEAFVIWYSPVVMFGSIMLTVLLPMIYSFLLFKKQESKMKFVYIILLVLIVGIVGIRLASKEDNWICQNGEWIQHGQPNTSRPTLPCK